MEADRVKHETRSSPPEPALFLLSQPCRSIVIETDVHVGMALQDAGWTLLGDRTVKRLRDGCCLVCPCRDQLDTGGPHDRRQAPRQRFAGHHTMRGEEPRTSARSLTRRSTGMAAKEAKTESMATEKPTTGDVTSRKRTQNARSRSRRTGGRPGDSITAHPVNAAAQPGVRPIESTSIMEVLRPPVEPGQYTARAMAQVFRRCRAAMGATGICWDNSGAESLWVDVQTRALLPPHLRD
jgi:hypothetical protein